MQLDKWVLKPTLILYFNKCSLIVLFAEQNLLSSSGCWLMSPHALLYVSGDGLAPRN